MVLSVEDFFEYFCPALLSICIFDRQPRDPCAVAEKDKRPVARFPQARRFLSFQRLIRAIVRSAVR